MGRRAKRQPVRLDENDLRRLVRGIMRENDAPDSRTEGPARRMPTIGTNVAGNPVQEPNEDLARKLEEALRLVRELEADLGQDISENFRPRGIGVDDHPFWPAISAVPFRIQSLNVALGTALAELKKIL